MRKIERVTYDAICALKPHADTLSIHEDLQAQDCLISIGGVHAVATNLEEAGLIRSRYVTQEGQRKRLCEPTRHGKVHAKETALRDRATHQNR